MPSPVGLLICMFNVICAKSFRPAWYNSNGSLCSGRRAASHGPRQRGRAVAPEYGGGREYDIEAEFMDELGPLPKARAAGQAPGTTAACFECHVMSLVLHSSYRTIGPLTCLLARPWLLL